MKALPIFALIVLVSACSDSSYSETNAGEYVILTDDAESIGGFALVHQDDLDFLVQVLDRDQDGTPDEIIYASLPSNSDQRVRVYDYDFDGQADARHFDSEAVELWYEGAWYAVVEVGDDRFIETESGEIAVTTGDYGRVEVSDN